MNAQEAKEAHDAALARAKQGIKCPACPGNVRVKVSPETPLTALFKLLDGPIPVGGWPEGWERWANVEEAHRQLLDAAVTAALEAPPLVGEDHGIVTCGGGATYYVSAYVLVHTLRALGCNLPVEWWHIGPEEMDPRMAHLALSLGNVHIRDCVSLAQLLKVQLRVLGGWESKVFALLHSNFAECLFLDADQLPARNPDYLFEDGRYQDCGAILWPDLLNSLGLDVTEQAFRTARLDIPGKLRMPSHHNPTDYRPVESGQLLIDRTRRGSELRVAWHICQRADYWWRHNSIGGGGNLIYGDKSAFYLAFERLQHDRSRPGGAYGRKANYVMPPGPGWTGGDKGGAFLQRDLDGLHLFSHRCQPAGLKLLLHAENVDNQLPNWSLALEALALLRGRWSGRPWDFADQDEHSIRAARQIPGDYMLYRGESDRGQRIHLSPGGTITAGQAAIERWSLRYLSGQDILVLSGPQKATVFLGIDRSGVWQHDPSKTVLIPAPPPGWTFPDRFSVAMFRDVRDLNEYGMPDRFNPCDIVLDLGGNVGAAALAAIERGAAWVHTVEPHPTNLAHLRKNLSSYTRRVTVWPVAAWHSLAMLRLFQPVGAQHAGGWSVCHDRGTVEAVAVPLDALILAATGGGVARIRLLKVDIEGAEFPAIISATRLDLVDEVVGEYHTAHCGPAPLVQLASALARAGFHVATKQHPSAVNLGHFRATRNVSAPYGGSGQLEAE